MQCAPSESSSSSLLLDSPNKSPSLEALVAELTVLDVDLTLMRAELWLRKSMTETSHLLIDFIEWTCLSIESTDRKLHVSRSTGSAVLDY